MQFQCRTCERSEDDVRLSKCPVCHKGFCDEHSYSMSGRRFCSRGCALHFFFDEDE